MLEDIRKRYENRLTDSEAWTEFYNNHEPDIAELLKEIDALNKDIEFRKLESKRDMERGLEKQREIVKLRKEGSLIDKYREALEEIAYSGPVEDFRDIAKSALAKE